MEKKSLSTFAISILSCIISLGILGGGFFIGKGFYTSRNNQPYITVKGLAERNVKADLAVWTISFSALGDDISTVNNELLRQQALVINFIKSQGFNDNEISLDPVKLTDRYANDYQNNNKPTQRYMIKGGIRIRSVNVDKVKLASQATGELVKQGVLLSMDNDDSISNPAFYFTQLNTIRPMMMSEATDSAYHVALQFAKDTASKLGSIRRANQGIFEITSRDLTGGMNSNEWQARRSEQGSIDKKVRLVSTIDYFLVKSSPF